MDLPTISEIIGYAVTLTVAWVGMYSIMKKTIAERERKQDNKIAHLELQDRAAFRKQLMDIVGHLTDRLRECEIRCIKCEEEHQETRIYLVKMENRVKELEEN